MDTTRPKFVPGRPPPWPLVLYFVALALGVVASLFFSLTLDGPEPSSARAQCHAIILIAGSIRFLISRYRDERNRRWIVYIVLFLLLPVLWHFGEAVVYDYSQRRHLVHFGTTP